MRLLRSQNQIPRKVRLVNKKVTISLLIGDFLLIAFLSFLVYLQPQYIFKQYPFKEKSIVIPSTKHVQRKMEKYKESAIQADMLINNIPKNKFIILPKYSIVQKSLQSCPENKCDSLNGSPFCTEPNLKTGENVWCITDIIKKREFSNLETMDFKFYRRIYPHQYERTLKEMEIHGKGERRSFEQESIPIMAGIDRLKMRLRWVDKVKSFVSGSEYVGKISFHELFYKLKVVDLKN